MEWHKVDPAPLEKVVDFINAWSPVALEAAGTYTGPTPEEVASQSGLAGAGAAELEQVATQLHQVFLGGTPRERRAALNRLVASLSLRPSVDAGGHRWLVADESTVGPARLAVGLWNHAGGDPDLERLGTCTANRCLDAFVDSTQAHTRRFCSLTCQNRAKVAAYRRRQKEARDQ